MIVDLVPSLARLYFLQRFPGMTLSYLQRAILVSIGLQHQSVDVIQKELGVPSNQLLALFNKAVRKFLAQLEAVMAKQLAAEQQAQDARTAALAGAAQDMRPTAQSLADEMRDGASAAKQQLQREMLENLNLLKYAVRGEDADWDAALAGSKVAKDGAVVVQVQSKKKHKRDDANDKPQAAAASSAAGGKKSKKAKYANLKK